MLNNYVILTEKGVNWLKLHLKFSKLKHLLTNKKYKDHFQLF